MITLTPEDIRLGCRAADWREAIDLASQEIETAGHTTPDYRQGLLDREAQSSTVLGNGIAIPHGTPHSREHVRSTGIRVLQFPDGVTWHDEARVHVLVTIAAQSDEHLDILRQLTRVLDRPGLAEQLAQANDQETLVAALSRTPISARCDRDTLLLRQPITDTGELALTVASRLQSLGCVDAPFIASLVAQAPQPLGRGVWLTHATVGVNQPALAIAAPARPRDDMQAVLCLAGEGEETQPLLEQIDHLLTQPTPVADLSAEALLACLAGEQADAVTREVRVLNAHGLHARPAKQLIQVARQQPATLKLRLLEGDVQTVSATSLTRVISLGARRGQTLVISASGDQANASVETLAAAIEAGLGESVTPLKATERSRTQTPEMSSTPIKPLVADEPLKAVAASPGLALAPAFIMRLPDLAYATEADDPAHENQRLNRSIDGAFEQLEILIKQAEGGEAGPILAVHAEMLRDDDLRQAAAEIIHEGASAEAAWWRAIDTAASAQEALADRLLAERAADLRDVGRRVLANLCGVSMPTPPDEPYILVADDLGPSDVARLDTQRVRGLVTARGGATAHSAILARALGLPAVVGVGERLLTLENSVELVVDGERGCIVPRPGPERRDRLQKRLEQLKTLQAQAHEARHQKATTQDGHTVEVCANLGNTAHTPEAVERGADGIGLLRTEFIFMAHSEAPDLETQKSEYLNAFDALNGLPLVARTLDVGGDKPLEYWPLPAEDNPFLGLRGIRLSLTRPAILETQLRALLTAAGQRPLRIMFPMVKDLAEFRAAKALVDKLQQEIHAPDVQVGVMIEIPSSALLAPTLAAEVDFFSIGTNDLTQYTLAIDRGHAELSAESDGLHPAVLQLIKMTVDAAHARGRWVGLCGELGSDPQAIPVLLGLGIDEFSVTSRRVPLVKACIRNLTMSDARALTRLALEQATAADVRDKLEGA